MSNGRTKYSEARCNHRCVNNKSISPRVQRPKGAGLDLQRARPSAETLWSSPQELPSLLFVQILVIKCELRDRPRI